VNTDIRHQTSVHLLAKDIIAKSKTFTTLDLYVAFSNFGKEVLLRRSDNINVKEVILEKKINDIVPDILLLKYMLRIKLIMIKKKKSRDCGY